MNIFNELRAFRDWSILNRPTSGEIALWYTLLNLNNMAGWSEWFTAANQTLQLLSGLSKTSLNRCRNQLIQRGLIEYRPNNTRQAGSYRLVSLWNQSQNHSQNQSETNRGTNLKLITDQSRNQSETNHGTNRGNINIQRHKQRERDYPPNPPAGGSAPAMVQYAEFVSMAEAEYQDLVDRFGEEEAINWVNRLNLWKGSTGKRTNSDYFTILNWHRRDLEKQSAVTTTSVAKHEEREIYIPPTPGGK